MENNKEDLNNENKKNELPKDTIIPAYMKKDKVENVEKDNSNLKKSAKKVKNKIDKSKTKKIIVLVVLAVLAIAVVLGIFYGGYILFRKIKYSKYDEYQKQMEIYALSSMYNNGKATSYERCTKSEAIKLIIAAVANVDEPYFYSENEEKYKNQYWVETAIQEGIITNEDINKDNANETVTNIEFVTYIQNARHVLIGGELDTSETPKFKDVSKLKAEQVSAISDLIYNGIIENSTSRFKPNKKLSKGEVNSLLCKIIKKYNLIVPNGKKFNVNKEKEPSNATEYPYILTDVSKEVYEKKFNVEDEEYYENPIKVFSYERAYMEKIIDYTEAYYSNLLNIDYNTINVENFIDALEEYTIYSIDEDEAKEYINYVKSNNIVLEGKVTAQAPILYNDGANYRFRVKIELNVKNSLTNKNLVFQDLIQDKDINYDKDTITFYADVTMNNMDLENNRTMFMEQECLYYQKADESIDGMSATDKQ